MKKVVSLLLAVILILAILPNAFAESASSEQTDRPENTQQSSTPAEPWTYHPSKGSASVSYNASTDTVQVTVTATEADSGDVVPVEGATACLYVGSTLHQTAITDSNGIAALSLSGLTIEQRAVTTVTAYKKVAGGTGINGSARDPLFRYFGTGGNYERYAIELHSESIDDNGNWVGEAIPPASESNKVDIVFIVDATGSMGDEINNVRDNIAEFADTLISRGLDIRFSIIEYRDITCDEPTILHTYDGTNWYRDMDAIIDCLSAIDTYPGGGGDEPETVIDPLGMVTRSSIMRWRSDAHKFAFVFTDAGYKIDNDYGYESLQEVADDLADMDIRVSVITNIGYCDYEYQPLVETTDGVFADIYGDFRTEMLNLAESLIVSTIRRVDLHLSEPRMLVNLAACYLANDATSRSAEYRNGVKRMLREYASRIAETTDGHVLIDKLLLFTANNRLDFYDTTKLPSMADIRIETRESERGVSGKNAQVWSNAYVAGFYSDSIVSGYSKNFENLTESELLQIDSRKSFLRIQLSGVEGAGWNNSMLDDAYAYSTTVAHETGHYLFGFYDEYMNADGENWRKLGVRYYDNYGLMDGQHYDIELSKAGVDYAYMDGPIAAAEKRLQTNHSYVYHESCEDSLARLLTEDYNFAAVYPVDKYVGAYKLNYTKAPDKDRTAKYSDAYLDDSDFLSLPADVADVYNLVSNGPTTEAVPTTAALFTVSVSAGPETIDVTLTPAQTTYTLAGVYYRTSGEAFLDADPAGEGAYSIPFTDDIVELCVIGQNGDGYVNNTYFIDQATGAEAGYLYNSADGCTVAYVLNDYSVNYLFTADNTDYRNGDYVSVNQATHIACSDPAAVNGGEIYSVAAARAEIDFTTLSWFLFADGVWTQLETEYTTEENQNIGARANWSGCGLYVLMAKAASTEPSLAAENVRFAQSDKVDARVTVEFDDPNTGAKYYNLYYGEDAFTDKTAENVFCRTYAAESPALTVDLLERGRSVCAAVEIVLEDGRTSPLSFVDLTAGEADSDGDGIPDWYCDQYNLWPADGEDKIIAESDDDGDGLSNLEEYTMGSDPTNPNDPYHTTNIPVESISLPDKLVMSITKSVKLVPEFLPTNATDQNVEWSSSDETVATVSSKGVVKPLSKGTAYITAITSDGGYVASCEVEVSKYGDDLLLDTPTVEINRSKATGKIKLTWDAVDGAAKYKIYRSTKKSSGFKLQKTVTGLSYTDKTAKVGKKYYYKVRAVDEGARSRYSSVLNGYRKLAQPVLKATHVASTGKNKISWKAISGAKSYKVYRATSEKGKYKLVKTTTKLSYTDTAAVAGKTYYYKVYAVAQIASAKSVYSKVKKLVCNLPAPKVSAGLTIELKPRLSWKTVTGAVKYKVYRATSKSGSYQLVSTTTARSFVDLKAKADKTYYYMVKAIAKKSSFDSAFSSVVKVRTSEPLT